MTKLIRWSSALGLAMGLCLPAAAEDFERSVAAEDGGTLRVDLHGGTVVVESHESPEVRVRAYAAGVGRSSLDLELTERGGEVSLRGGARGWRTPGSCCSCTGCRGGRGSGRRQIQPLWERSLRGRSRPWTPSSMRTGIDSEH